MAWILDPLGRTRREGRVSSAESPSGSWRSEALPRKVRKKVGASKSEAAGAGGWSTSRRKFLSLRRPLRVTVQGEPGWRRLVQRDGLVTGMGSAVSAGVTLHERGIRSRPRDALRDIGLSSDSQPIMKLRTAGLSFDSQAKINLQMEGLSFDSQLLLALLANLLEVLSLPMMTAALLLVWGAASRAPARYGSWSGLEI